MPDLLIPTGPLTVKFARTAKDAFGRLRVSNNHQLFDSQFLFDKLPLVWDEKLTGSPVTPTRATDSTITLATTTSGQSIIRQTKRYWRYRAGQSFASICTMSGMQPETNIEKEVGLGDDTDGVFLQSKNSTEYLTIKSSTSVGDQEIARTDWNFDKFDGTGPSGITIDFSKAQIFVMDLQWLGVGTVVCAFEFSREIHIAHIFTHVNDKTTTYMRSGSLPVRYSITQTGAGSGSMVQICSSVLREGGDEELGIITSMATNPGGISIGNSNLTSLISVRLKSAYIRAFAEPIATTIFNIGSTEVFWQMIKNPTLGGALTWTNENDSILQKSVTQQTYTPGTGTILAGGYAHGSGSRVPDSNSVDNLLGLSADIDGVADIISIVAIALSGSQATGAHLSFKAVY